MVVEDKDSKSDVWLKMETSLDIDAFDVNINFIRNTMLLAVPCTSAVDEVAIKLNQSPESSLSCPRYHLFESPYTLRTVPDSHTDHPFCIPPCVFIFNSSTKEN